MLQDGYCHIDNVTLTAKITGYVNVTSGDADALKVALAKHGPISVAIDASRKTFSFYSNGIYYDPECRKFWCYIIHLTGNQIVFYLRMQYFLVSWMCDTKLLENILIFVNLFRTLSHYKENISKL